MRDLHETAGPLEASIFVEALRAIPAAFLGLGLIAHALLWALATHIAEPSPPPQMAVAIALGREWMLGYEQMPPLAAWISAAVFHVTNSLFAVRLAAALCVASAGWILFLFARRVIRERHAAIAVLLMVGVFPVAFPGSALTGDLLQMPLAAAAILMWWIAVDERNPNAWVALGAIAGVMIYGGPQVVALLPVLVFATLFGAQGRAAITRTDAQLCIFVGVLVFAHLAGPRVIWLWHHGCENFFAGAGAGIAPPDLVSPLRLAIMALAGHFGFALLLLLATAYGAKAKDNAPVFVREPTTSFFRNSAVALAVLPVLIALLVLCAAGQAARVQLLSSLMMLSGVAAVLLGGIHLTIRRQKIVGLVALIYLIAPVAMQIGFSYAPGWLGDNRASNWPANSVARILTEIYQTRTGRPLEFLIGERRTAAQIAALSADRPHVYIDADRARAPWIDEKEFREKGGVVFWQIQGTDSAPPAEYVTRLPAFVAEAPLRLPWARSGGDPVRLGWAIVPPAR